MKTPTGRRTDVRKPRSPGENGSRPPPAASTGDAGVWSPGVSSEQHAALLGRIVGLMPQVEELMAGLAARLLGAGAKPGRAAFRGLAGDEGQMRLLHTLLAETPANAGRDKIEAAIAHYAEARRRWRAYVCGLWYTHESGRTRLAAPEAGDPGTFPVRREVKPAELAAEMVRLEALVATLPGIGRAELRPPARQPGGRRGPVPGKVGRAAPKGEAGRRRRRSPRWALPSSTAASAGEEPALLPGAETGEG